MQIVNNIHLGRSGLAFEKVAQTFKITNVANLGLNAIVASQAKVIKPKLYLVKGN